MSKLFKDDTKAFVTWVRLHDIDRPWNINVGYYRLVADMALPLYYVALLGLESVLTNILPIDNCDLRSSEMVNAQGGEHGNALQAASWSGHKNVVQMLLDYGAEVNVQVGRCDNPL